jgi:hypothetical protein
MMERPTVALGIAAQKTTSLHLWPRPPKWWSVELFSVNGVWRYCLDNDPRIGIIYRIRDEVFPSNDCH